MVEETWVLEIVDGPANFEAFPAIREIEGTYAALLSLWAVAAAVRVLSVLTQTAAEMNLSQVVIHIASSARKLGSLLRYILEITVINRFIRATECPAEQV